MNILLTSVGRRKYIVEYFKTALTGIGKIYTSNSAFTIAMKESDGYFISPLIYEDNYIESIIEYCKKFNISAVISLFDIDLMVLAQNQKIFDNNSIKLILAPEESIRVCNDKWETYLFLKNNGIKTPKTFLRIEQVTEAISKNEIQFPLIVKPRWGMASLGIYKVDDYAELEVLYKRSRKETFNSYLKYESRLTEDESTIIQEYLKGNEYGLDVINDFQGNYVNTFAKWKISMRAGETDIGKTVDNEPFIETAKLLSREIKQLGILSVDCIEQNGEINVIEMNCRISGHYPLSHLAGVDYPGQIVQWLKGEGNDNSKLKFKVGLTITKDLVPTILEE
jgi:carbamoyl-phosphate synthase large subunit